jgi:TM2 domain-containing membrane protein YozV
MSGPNLPEPYQQRPYSAPPSSPAQHYIPAAAAAPFGVDPVTGTPLSDKSKMVAGLLQLLPGLLLGLGGIGRLYAGHTTLGVIQLVVTAVGWISFWCGFLLLFPFFLFFCAWLWFVIDGIVLLAGRSSDREGRLLRS